MKTIIRFMTFVAVCLILTCCVAVGGQSSGEKENKEKENKEKRTISRTAALNALYDNTTLGEVHLTFTDEQWNTLVSNSNSGNKTLYSSCDFVYKKGYKTYTMSNIGIKNRGNTSFRAPQNSSGDYQQAHFKLKFNKNVDDTEHHLERAAKAMNLKYMLSDASYVQEVYCYDLFKRFGVLTAPRCSYSKLYIKVGSKDEAYFGMYKSIESIDKQYLKERVAAGVFKGDDGNLWKCLYQSDGPADMNSTSANLFGVDTASHTPVYSLKTNEDDETTKAKAITQFETFISNLKSKSGDEFKSWIAGAFDVDGFLKALAVDVACGMWDDIWRNYNNYYFYFDTDGKAHFIPYDYDNSLGAPNDGLMQHPAEQDPLEWGTDNAVLVKKILDVDEYLTKYKQYLADLASDDKEYLTLSASQSRINAWYALIEQYCDTSTYDADWHASKDGASDWSMTKGKPSSLYNFLTDENNYFTLRCAAINDIANPPSAELLGYSVSDDKITFTFDPKMWKNITNDYMTTYGDSLYIKGSFNGWDVGSGNDMAAWKLTEDNGIWKITLPTSTVTNNSQFKYWFNTTNSGDWYGVSDRAAGYEYPLGYGDNNIIIKY
ncbi:MAG: CotH kinase family protein [Spirochaetales bacterium]|nr:CotH kinase family protein [Spirochaetales bacterium]